ncbi:hypothetical protein EDC52_103320 [Biostraticola tofi]|uniref:Uncharacterized protein n=1 Tax=Biostraticola tofi TaxID=466109 RepID=A0A4V2W558_9GAMM|nr:hypothetical protein EDC52_103320 [Biostraticola tofi]
MAKLCFLVVAVLSLVVDTLLLPVDMRYGRYE